MNILILSCGTRNKIVRYFKNELDGIGKVIAADCSPLAPALYQADSYYIVPKIGAPEYIETILKICTEEQISGIFSLIDPELSLLAANKKAFEDNGIVPFVSEFNVTEVCFDKKRMYDFCVKNDFNTVPTYKNIDVFHLAKDRGEITYPVFVKPAKGSCSVAIQKVTDEETLKLMCKKNPELIIQKLMTGQEYGIDAYCDLLSGEVTSVFIKKKLLMRAGETDKAVSVRNQEMENHIRNFLIKLGTKGPVDIDLFEENGTYYISEVNPRFGGGYPLAYECGVNIPLQMINNIKGNKNKTFSSNYEAGIYMMKYLDLKIINEQKQVLI